LEKNILKLLYCIYAFVGNRQAWHVYHSDESDVIKEALSYQQGNKGFGHSVPNLMVIATDLKAFMPGQEHY
jgi:hypothetical protein